MKERQRWQPEEDALLRAYVKQYGGKEWNMVSHRMGKTLDRDAKSCLERWKNYLKPGIKKGSLTEEEQNLVISLQAKYGNKWKKIASEVPGRTAKRLGKWWEVFKEKQRKALLQGLAPASSSAAAAAATPQLEESGAAAVAAVQSKYDHILETFAEKYVQPKLKEQQQPPPPPPPPHYVPMPNLSLDPSPILSLATATTAAAPPEIAASAALPPWLSSSSSTSSCSSSTVSPSVSLSLSPSELPASPEIVLSRFLPVHQLSAVAQGVKELDEGRQGWALHKKEATWRLSRLEQQLESEKARKKREKIEEIEARIRRLREEELVILERIDNECREQLCSIQRDAEVKETKMVELWISKHIKLAKLLEQMGIHHCNPPLN